MFNSIKLCASRTLSLAPRLFSTSLIRNTQLDPTQAATLNQKCFVVDEYDNVINTWSKKKCHLVDAQGNIPLHRGFSVFLFNKSGDLLIQKRTNTKITFPNCYSDSCSSHPLADVAGDDEEKEEALGVKRAAQRRLSYEFGIPLQQIPLDLFTYITRFHYKDKGDGVWGEHEIAYIFFVQCDVALKPNSNEISEYKFVSRSEFDNYINNLRGPLTPWFNLIVKHRLRLWWDNLHNLDKFKDHKQIIRWC